MTALKRPVKPNRGGAIRPQADTPRRHFLFADVTQGEYEEIRQHCIDRHISISQFIADLVLKDAAKPRSKRKQKVILQPKIELTPEEQDKLELLTRLYQKESIGDFIRDVLQPNLQIRRVHSPLKTTSLRFYLSEQEHEKVMKHIAGTGISVRNYGAILAIRAVRKERKKQK